MVSVLPRELFTCRTSVRPVMSWKLSRSPVTISQSQPDSSHILATVPSTSSASQPSAASCFMPIADSSSFKTGICTARSSGMGLR